MQTIVSFKPATPLSPEIALALPLTAAYATWHAEAVVQTLQPTPPHPLSQVQLDEVKFAKPGDDADGWAKERLEPSNMVPPHPGCAQVAPPKPGGQRQLEALDGEVSP